MIRLLLLAVMLTGCVASSSVKPVVPMPPPKPKTLTLGVIVSDPVYYTDHDGRQACMDIVGFGFRQFTKRATNCVCLTEVHQASGEQYLQQRVILADDSVCHPEQAPSSEKEPNSTL